jgi:hypothetical protein
MLAPVACGQTTRSAPARPQPVLAGHLLGPRQAIIDLDDDRAARLHLAGPSPRYRLAAAVDLIRRYWQHGPDGLTPEFTV